MSLESLNARVGPNKFSPTKSSDTLRTEGFWSEINGEANTCSGNALNDLAELQKSPALLHFVVYGNVAATFGYPSQHATDETTNYYLTLFKLRGAASTNLASGTINREYVPENRAAIELFIRQNRLRHLLEQAIKPLNENFGEESVKVLKLVVDDEGWQTLFCLVKVAGSWESAQRSLAAFDREWWLDHSRHVAGKLNFDYELV